MYIVVYDYYNANKVLLATNWPTHLTYTYTHTHTPPTHIHTHHTHTSHTHTPTHLPHTYTHTHTPTTHINTPFPSPSCSDLWVRPPWTLHSAILRPSLERLYPECWVAALTCDTSYCPPIEPPCHNTCPRGQAAHLCHTQWWMRINNVTGSGIRVIILEQSIIPDDKSLRNDKFSVHIPCSMTGRWKLEIAIMRKCPLKNC